jgi:hypothetical protein
MSFQGTFKSKPKQIVSHREQEVWLGCFEVSSDLRNIALGNRRDC